MKAIVPAINAVEVRKDVGAKSKAGDKVATTPAAAIITHLSQRGRIVQHKQLD